MSTYAFFLSNRRESLVRAFRKKTPLGVRRCGGGAKGGMDKVRSFVTFFLGWPPLVIVDFQLFLVKYLSMHLGTLLIRSCSMSTSVIT